jgi:carbamoyltransferase|tara:strand:+ start:2007 stop:3746 length:1740 start_codon:yes stop_codon:yes gene_type:complete
MKNILGLIYQNCSDPSATLIKNGQIVAIVEEERVLRDKHAVNKFPINAINSCLNIANLEINDIDIISIGWDASKFPAKIKDFYEEIRKVHAPLSKKSIEWQNKNINYYTKENLLNTLKQNLFPKKKEIPSKIKVVFTPHHYSHACTAFYMSGFSEAAVITMDGHGEEDCTNLWVADNYQIKKIKQWNIPNSMGWFYTKFTQWFGFRPHDGEGKLMGLAAYGSHDPELAKKVDEICKLTDDDRIYDVNSSFFFAENVGNTSFCKEWIDLFGEPLPYEKKIEYSDYHKNLAFAVQQKLEDVGVALAKYILNKTGKTKLCVAGGSFMNCKMNGVLAQHVGFDNFFAQPMAGDNGISMGAAVAAASKTNVRWPKMDHLYYGPKYTKNQIEKALEEQKKAIKYSLSSNIEKDVAGLLSKSKVVGWFQGPMESGARALGNRSILGNPLDPNARNLINEKVKFREMWRPFCPSTLEEEGQKFFNYEGKLPFMIVACEVNKEYADKIPSVVHCDNTVRVQTVSKETNPKYYKMIYEFGKITGIPIVLNTSFNVKGQAIVCSPNDAIKCFLNTGMDYVAIGDYLVSRL